MLGTSSAVRTAILSTSCGEPIGWERALFLNRQTLSVGTGRRALLVFLDRSAKGAVGEVFLDADYVGPFFELFCNRRSTARDPNLQFGIRIERSSCFNAELSDTPIENAVVAHLGASQSLFIDHDQPMIGEDQHISKYLETAPNCLTRRKHWLKLGLHLSDIDLGRIAEEAAEQSHQLNVMILADVL